MTMIILFFCHLVCYIISIILRIIIYKYIKKKPPGQQSVLDLLILDIISLQAFYSTSFLVVMLVIATPVAVAQPVPAPAAIDSHVAKLMEEQDVKGMAIAVIDQGRVVHVAAYGLRNVEKNEPLGVRTVMYGASFTKTAFAYMVLQLVDEGLVDLDRVVLEDCGESLLVNRLGDLEAGGATPQDRIDGSA